MKKIQEFLIIALIALFTVLNAGIVYAQETQQGGQADNTGTNPINFTNDFRIYNNFSELNTAGDGKANTTTMEFRTPFADGKWQFRIKAPYVWKEADLTGNGVNNIDDHGIGNLSMRFLTVPVMNKEKKFALAAGLEMFFDTANDPAIAESSTSLGPQVFAVFFRPPGGGALMAPAYQHVFSVGGKDVHRGQIDFFYLWSFPKKFFNWALINPQGVINYEADNDSSWNIDLETGKMLTKHQSVYVRPGFGIGTDRTFDWDIEGGWKVVW
jgi:hypothetical protein